MKDKSQKILFVGFASIDLINDRRYLGGAGGGMALNAGLLGVEASLLAPLANDQDGKLYKSELHNRNVDIHLSKPEGVGLPHCEIRDSHAPGSHRIWKANGVEATVSKMHVTRADLAEFETAILCNAPRQLVEQITSGFNGRLVYIPGPQIVHNPSMLYKPALKKATIIFGNEEETPIIKQQGQITFTGRIFVQTLGEQGGKVFYDNTMVPFSAPRIDGLAEPTGAGDSFALGFILETLNQGTVANAILQGKQLARRVIGQTGSVLYSLE